MKPYRWVALFSLTLLGHYAQADTVTFKTGKNLECKAVSIPDDDSRIRLILDKEEKSSVVVSMDKITKIDYDYDTRFEALSEDDWLGHYNLGIWCMERGIYDKALLRFLYVHGKKGIPLQIELNLARMFEKQIIPQYLAARDHYRKYLEIRPDCPEKKEVLAALVELQKIIVEKGLDKEEDSENSSSQYFPGDGLERNSWQPVTWGYNARVSTPSLKGSGGDTVLEVSYDNKTKDGKRLPGSKQKTPLQLRVDKNISGTPMVCFDVYNPSNKPMKMTVALQTGSSYEWHESKTITIAPGKWLTGIKLDTSSKIWKSEASHWRNSIEVKNSNNVRNLILLLYNGDKKGKVYFDSISFSPKE